MPKSFNLFGRQITFGDDYLDYFLIHEEYIILAQEAYSEYIRLYKSYASIEKVIENTETDCGEIILNAIKHAVKIFIDYDILEIDEESFFSQYYSYYENFEERFLGVEEKYLDILQHSHEVDDYRIARRQSRSRFIGGGFGISGAVKGMATAGVANMAAGALHMAFNSMGKAASMVGDSIKKSNIYDDKSNMENIAIGLYNSIYNMHYDVVNVISDLGGEVFTGYLDTDVKKVESMFNNMKTINIDSQKKLDLFCKMINIYPFDERIYIELFKEFGDYDNNVQNLAELFGFDLNDIKMDSMQKYFETVFPGLRGEKDSIKVKNYYLELAHKYGVSKKLIVEPLKKFDERINEFAKNERLVENIWFDSKVEADKARGEFQSIAQIIKSGNVNTYLGVHDILTKLDSMQFVTKIYTNTRQELYSKYEKLELEERSFDGLVCESVTDAHILKELKIIAERKYNDLIDVSSAVDQFELLQNKLDNKYPDYISSKSQVLQNKYSKIDIDMRTFDGVVCESIADTHILKELKKLCDKKYSDIPTVITAIQQFDLIQGDIKGKYSTYILLLKSILENTYKRIDIKSRTVGQKLYNTVEEADIARQERKTQNQKKIKKAGILTTNIIRYVLDSILLPEIIFIYYIIFSVFFSNLAKGFVGTIVAILILISVPGVIIWNIIYDKIYKKPVKLAMSTNNIIFVHDFTNENVVAPIGKAWKALLLGFFVPFDRRDFKNGLIFILVSHIGLFIFCNIYLFFKYNEIYIKRLLKKGFRPYDEEQANKLNSLGINWQKT